MRLELFFNETYTRREKKEQKLPVNVILFLVLTLVRESSIKINSSN